MTGLSRRSILAAPFALAAASVAPKPSANPLGYGFTKRLRPYYVSKFRNVKWAPLDAPERPFKLLSADLDIWSLDGTCLSEVGDQHQGAVADSLPSSAKRITLDNAEVRQALDLHDHRLDGEGGLVRVIDEHVFDQCSQQEPGSGELHGERIRRRPASLPNFSHFLNSLVGVATAMVKRLGRVFKIARAAVVAFLVICVVEIVASDYEIG